MLTQNDWEGEKIPQSAPRHSKGQQEGCKRDMKDDLHSRASPVCKKQIIADISTLFSKSIYKKYLKARKKKNIKKTPNPEGKRWIHNSL